MKDTNEAKKFYKELDAAIRKFEGEDVVTLGDFNAKLGSKDFDGGPIGSHARGIRNENGEFLHDWLEDHKFFATNTFFKHRACNITTWAGVIRGRRVFNQIDFIHLRNSRKHSVTDARSHQIFTVDSDHRLVMVTMWRKNDFERTKKVKAQTTTDPTLLFLQKKNQRS